MTSNTQLRWVPAVSLLLSLAGLAVSVYLTVAHFREGVLLCAENAVIDCGTVTTSEQSELLGIPVAVLGLAFFAFLTVLCLPVAWRDDRLHWVRLASIAVGVLFVVYLVAAEFVLIGKVCLWCTAVHVITLALAGVLVTGALRRSSL
ncbi:vitamin K epoxide reductase family protein [Actinosynnema sp. NPDC047251]|uniref:Putative membrane protein n=1 Tax=Saccharothrix espanaensis (strain ATCC 51144 / DSM 44229 / JCM 9112 / NBRC 15066 / NRRL 15764) TaxID=1179773 RepID=K0KA88_SACES|nr:vitamin K epoxide reductase family protein [Saccharothrix espanaensis]CCH34447.1 putative membrane protein [Saccharothrix espanaensis DSM 44229]